MIYGAAENQYLNSGGYGGGFGGWGFGGGGGGFGSGFLGGILGGALFGGRGGLFGGRDGCCDKGHGHHDGIATGIILDDAHYNSLQNSIGQVKTEVGAIGSSIKDNITALGYNISDKFAGTNAAIANVNYNQAINTKDIIHDIDIQSCNLGSKIDKCCCETNHNIDNKFFALSKQMSDCCCELQKEGLKNTQLILSKLTENEIQALRDRLCRCEKDNDNFRLTNSIIANFRQQAATVGSNFNTGTQTQSTSNNSGQQIGA